MGARRRHRRLNRPQQCRRPASYRRRAGHNLRWPIAPRTVFHPVPSRFPNSRFFVADRAGVQSWRCRRSPHPIQRASWRSQRDWRPRESTRRLFGCHSLLAGAYAWNDVRFERHHSPTRHHGRRGRSHDGLPCGAPGLPFVAVVCSAYSGFSPETGLRAIYPNSRILGGYTSMSAKR